MAEWAERIAAVRGKLGLTKAALSRLLNTTYPTILRWEQGQPPHECAEILIGLLDAYPEEGARLLFGRLERHELGPMFGEQESWSERVRRLRERLDLTQAEFGKLIGVQTGVANGWERGRHEPGGCSEVLIDLLEYNLDEVAPLLWPTLAWKTIQETESESELPDRPKLEADQAEVSERPDQEWPPERIRAIRESLRLSKVNFASLLHMAVVTPYKWEEGTPPGPCARILLLLLETHGPRAMELLATMRPDDATWPPERVQKVRETLGLSRPEMAEILGVQDPWVLIQWERRGFHVVGCQRLLYSLLEEHSEKMMELFRALPRR